MALTATDFRFVHWRLALLAIGGNFHLTSKAEEWTFQAGNELHVLAVVCQADVWYRAGAAQIGRPGEGR